MTKHAGKPTFRRMRAKKKIPPPPLFHIERFLD